MEVYAVKGVQQFDCDQAYTKETKELLASYDNLKEIYFRYTVKKTGTKTMLREDFLLRKHLLRQ